MTKGFINFIREQGVIGLAIGLVLGSAVTTVVKSFVENIINPLVGLLISDGALNHLSIVLADETATSKAVVLGYGAFLSSILDFLIIAAVVYYIFKGLGLESLDKCKD